MVAGCHEEVTCALLVDWIVLSMLHFNNLFLRRLAPAPRLRQILGSMDPFPYNITITSQTASIVYSPYRDGDPTEGWNVSYSLGVKDTGFSVPQGVGVDSHVTTHDGATMELNWVGTAVYLYGEASSASYSIDVDGSTLASSLASVPQGGLLGSRTGLDYANHTVKLTTRGSGQVAFQYADLTIGIGYDKYVAIPDSQRILSLLIRIIFV